MKTLGERLLRCVNISGPELLDSMVKMCKKHLLQKRWGAVFTLWASQEIIEYKIKLKSDSNDGPNDATAHQESAQYARWPVHH